MSKRRQEEPDIKEKEKEKEKETEEGNADAQVPQTPITKKARLDLPVVTVATPEGFATPISGSKGEVLVSPKEKIEQKLQACSHVQLELIPTRIVRAEPHLEPIILAEIEKIKEEELQKKGLPTKDEPEQGGGDPI